jgi:TP901 family phage tail tape measure protein
VAGGKVSILVDPDFTGFPGKLQAGLAGATGAASNAGRVIGMAIAAGTAVAAVGLQKVITLGITYEQNMNTLQAVTGATAAQMQAVGATASQLGSDLSLPATSAADAAAAMTELAKGGLTVDQAMQAARGTLQLAAAAQIDGAAAAEIQTNALNAFGLSADNAGRVADVLANVANASSGEITDFAAALQAGSAVASQFGISIEDTATALGLFANSGIKGSDAGTLLKSALLALASPSKQGAKALEELGVNAFNAQGNFVGLPAIFDQLNAASKRMTPEQYAAAASIAFGSDAARLAGIAARTSGGDWDKMSAAVSKSGGAADVAAAKTKGLGGAVEGFKSQLETVGLQVFDKIKTPLESMVRSAAEGLPKVVDQLGQLGTKGLAAVRPIGDGFKAVWDSLEPVRTGIANIVTAGGGLGTVAAAASLLGGALQIVATVIGPLATLAGGLLTIFSQLPGPIQTAALALLALKVGPAILSGLSGGLRKTNTEAGGANRAVGLLGKSFQAATSPVRALVTGTASAGSAIKSFGQEMKVQQSLAKSYGTNLGTLGAAHATFATTGNTAITAVRNFSTSLQAIQAGARAAGTSITPVQASMKALAETRADTTLGAIARSFDTAAAGATRFKTTAGLAAGVGKTITTGLGSLVGFLGGPWGLALAAGALALGAFGASQEAAKQKAAEHRAELDSLRGTLDQVTGAVTQATITEKANQLAKDGTLQKVKDLGINTNDYTRAMLGEAGALGTVNTQLQAHVQNMIATSPVYQEAGTSIDALGLTLDDLTQAALGSPAALQKIQLAIGSIPSAEAQAAMRLLVDEMLAAAAPAADLAKSIGLSVPEIQKLKQEQQLAAEASKSFGESLALVSNSLGGLKSGAAPTAAMATALNGLSDAAKKAATDAGTAALALGGVEGASAAAAKSMAESRAAFVAAAEGAGLTTEAANALADKIGLIPAVAATQFTTNAAAVEQEVTGIVQKMQAIPGQKTITVDFLSAAAEKQLTDLGAKITRMPNGMVKIDADDSLAKSKADQLKPYIDGIVGMAKADADTAPGTAKGDALKVYIDQLQAFVQMDGNIQPGTAKADMLKQHVDNLIGIMTQDGNNQPGTQKGDELKAYVDGLKATVLVDADVEQAIQQINDFVANASQMQIRIPILATGGLAIGGIVEKYAKGGLAGARPMRANFGQIVPPRRLRVIGDRSRDDEAFIPINRSARSKMLLMMAAQRMGFDLVRRYAEGGIEAARLQSTSLSRLRSEVRAAAAGASAAAGPASSGPLVGTINVAPPAGIGPSAVAGEVMFRLRHTRRGVHSDR